MFLQRTISLCTAMPLTCNHNSDNADTTNIKGNALQFNQNVYLNKTCYAFIPFNDFKKSNILKQKFIFKPQRENLLNI